jgi:dolichol-phosphate mannosyltransferase
MGENGELLRDEKRPMVSLVVPCFNEAEVLPELVRRLGALADVLEANNDVEILLVDDGSRDATWELIGAAAREDGRKRIGGVRLARNFGQQAALWCGYERARGDAVVTLDADLQDPPEVVLDLVAEWAIPRGYPADVVHAVRDERHGETRFKKWTASLFYRGLRWAGADFLEVDAGEFRLVSRRGVDILLDMPERHRLLRGMVAWTGLETATVHYTRAARSAGSGKYSIPRMVRLAMDGMLSFSRLPVRLIYLAAAALLVFFLGYMVLGLRLDGWRFLSSGGGAIVMAVTLFGTTTLLAVGILGEYAVRIFEEVKQRPPYVVRDVIASGVGRKPGSRGRSREARPRRERV